MLFPDQLLSSSSKNLLKSLWFIDRRLRLMYFLDDNKDVCSRQCSQWLCHCNHHSLSETSNDNYAMSLSCFIILRSFSLTLFPPSVMCMFRENLLVMLLSLTTFSILHFLRRVICDLLKILAQFSFIFAHELLLGVAQFSHGIYNEKIHMENIVEQEMII